MTFPFCTKSGESLVEVIMAIFVVAIGASVAATLVVTSFQSNNFSRDNLIAVNLAAEGIEAVRSIRDTNWLQYSFDRTNCWNIKPDAICSSPYQLITSGNYTVHEDLNNRWQIDPIVSGDLNLKNANDDEDIPYSLKLVNLFGSNQPDLKFYVPKDFVCSLPCIELPDENANLRFYRMIKILNQPSDNDVKTINVQSLVQWRSQGIIHQVSFATQLTNYQE